jgi:DNA-binding CsgD family transcriptional regulator
MTTTPPGSERPTPPKAAAQSSSQAGGPQRSARPAAGAAAPARRQASAGDEIMHRKRSSALSPRQLDCLSLAAKGNTSAEVARTLGISPRTVVQMKRVEGRFRITEVWYEPLRKRALAA